MDSKSAKLNTFTGENVKDDNNLSVSDSKSSIESENQTWSYVKTHRPVRHSSSASQNVQIINIEQNLGESDSDISIKGVSTDCDSIMMHDISKLDANNFMPPNVGSVNVQNAQSAMFGNRTIYNGSVTIQHFADERPANKAQKIKEQQNVDVITVNHRRSKPKGSHNKWQMGWKHVNDNKTTYVTGILILLLLTTVIFLFVNKFYEHSGNSSKPIRQPLLIISRSEWNASKPQGDTINITLPSVRVIITDTETKSCFETSTCARIVQELQHRQMGWLGYADIGTNFLVGGDGAVYMGRGWDIEFEVGDPDAKYKEKSIYITFIGKFDKKAPPQKQLDAAQKLIELGVEQNKLSTSYNLYGQYQVEPLEDSRKVLYQIIRTWGHWKETFE